MSAARIEFRGVGKRYGDVRAVKPLDLVVEGGTLVTLLGPSGCGKTTLLRMIAGLEAPSEGRILIGGRDVTDLPPGERNVSMVFQSYALFPHMTVLENVAYGLVSSGLARREAERRAAAALEGVGLPGFGPRQTFEMSGGQQQRVALARALVLEPEVLLFDEPLSNLDTRLRRTMREEIRALQQRLGVTVVYVTHDQAEALAISNRIVVMRNAEIAQAGTPVELYTRPETGFVASFMGEANHVRGIVEEVEDDLVRVALGPLRMRLPHRGLPRGPCDVIIRPEAVRFDPHGTLPAEVLRATYMGSHVEYRLTTSLGELLAIVPSGVPVRPSGTSLQLALDPAGVFPVRAASGSE